ncbi:MAG TPA: S41 family peptidase [Vicinamibacterales bacterium]|jgi:carboxyl-terminal processing protease|nr:S41 family peptidase [Vicinamibacterales bacterium]
MTTRTRLSVLLISTPLLAFIVIGGALGRASSGDDAFQHLRVFEDVVSLILNNYVEEVKVDHVMEGAMRGLADGLDPDSAYLTPEEVKALDASGPCASLSPSAACASSGVPAGDVGVELTRQYYLRVIAARDGSPAARAGLQTGDYVRAIDGKPTRDMSVWEGARMLRGTPGSKVTLTVIRGNAADPHDVALVRETSPGSIVSGRLLEPGIGVIRIAAFGTGTAGRVREQVEQLTRAGATHLIIDLRHTAEGPYENGIETARLFVKDGTLVQIAGRDPQQKAEEKSATANPPASTKVSPAAIRQTISARPGDGAIATPVTLLVTTGTSGAAELFVAALDGNKRADVVGERTLGRAGVQKLVRLPDGRGLWLTYERYVAPSGDTISGRGIAPDQEVDEPDVEWGEPVPSTDPILDAAVARIKK